LETTVVAATRLGLADYLRRKRLILLGSNKKQTVMKIDIQNIQEISPVILLSVLLFVSCTQLPVDEDTEQLSDTASVVEASVAENSTMDSSVLEESEEMALTEQEIIDGESNFESIENMLETEAGIPQTESLESLEIASLEPSLEEDTDTLPSPEELAQINQEMLIHQRNVESLCREIGNKLGSVSVEDCLIQELEYAGAYSVNARPLAMRDFHPNSAEDSQGAEIGDRILILGGIHGDEYSSISIMFKWMSLLQQNGGNDYSWRFLPAVNPDGLLDGQAIRQNASGVDLNRNFPSQDWDATALDYWRNNTGENPRRYPGEEAASEPEVRWIIEQIEKFNPAVIVSVHAPYHLLDFDGPSQAPDKIGDLYLHQLGVYPGSLGNYAGLDLGIPVVTLELPSAGIMPPVEQIETMWNDMLFWLNTRSQHGQNASL
jgi:hypothetical protein